MSNIGDEQRAIGLEKAVIADIGRYKCVGLRCLGVGDEVGAAASAECDALQIAPQKRRMFDAIGVENGFQLR